MYSIHQIPTGYQCARCKATGVKLWRTAGLFLEHIVLECAVCIILSEKLEGTLSCAGRYSGGPSGPSDQMAGRVPAVPTEDGQTFWGYTSVPQDAVDWWRSLPTLSFGAERHGYMQSLELEIEDLREEARVLWLERQRTRGTDDYRYTVLRYDLAAREAGALIAQREYLKASRG